MREYFCKLCKTFVEVEGTSRLRIVRCPDCLGYMWPARKADYEIDE